MANSSENGKNRFTHRHEHDTYFGRKVNVTILSSSLCLPSQGLRSRVSGLVEGSSEEAN